VLALAVRISSNSKKKSAKGSPGENFPRERGLLPHPARSRSLVQGGVCRG
jgi:hypothetical protein